ncbi:Protein CBG27695 [Caenorhabditis briggsae]|uniref:Protein CBG27695 n=1 Tax=Caenorhabditis briggsae TaxID=6238 RepID=B6IJE0_CAEBR|nr:Protein CBG27695 [Caenorhabditis briggsae]CAR99974.1 Protein CBG27695 [Caenorhabditis briggsae]
MARRSATSSLPFSPASSSPSAPSSAEPSASDDMGSSEFGHEDRSSNSSKREIANARRREGRARTKKLKGETLALERARKTDEVKQAIRTLHSFALNGAFFTDQHADMLHEFSTMDLPAELSEDLNELLLRQKLLERIAGGVVAMMAQRQTPEDLKRIEQKGKRNARLEVAAQYIEVFRNQTVLGNCFTEYQKQNISEISLMPDLPQHQKEELKQIAKHQEQVEVERKKKAEAEGKKKAEAEARRREREERGRKAKEDTQLDTLKHSIIIKCVEISSLRIKSKNLGDPHARSTSTSKRGNQADRGTSSTSRADEDESSDTNVSDATHTYDTNAGNASWKGTLAFSQTPLPPAIALPTPRLAIQAAQPAPSASVSVFSVKKRVELELWPTNGYSEKKNHRDPMFFTVEETANGERIERILHQRTIVSVRHVVCSMRNRLMCDDVTSLWALRIEDHCVKQFHSEEQLAVVRQFVGQQRVIMFYDDEIAGRIPQRDAYVVHSNFKSHTGP